MSRMRQLLQRLFHAVRPGRAEPELAREIASHLALLQEEFERQGLPPAEARRAARRAFGGVEQAKELQRDARSFRWLTEAERDARYAVRTMGRTPGFTIVAVATLALGIGANSAIFTVVNAVLLRPLPYPEPDRLVGIEQRHATFGSELVTWPDYAEWRERTATLEDMGGAWRLVYNLTGIEEPERLPAAAATASLFTTLRVAPAVGRAFAPGDPADARTVVLSDRLWKRRFAGAPDAIGRKVALNGVLHTVIGVMPPGFAWPESTELWVPLVPEPGMTRGYHMLEVVGRLKDEMTIASARTELATFAAAAAAAHPQTNNNRGIQVSSLLEHTVGSTSRPLMLLAAAAGCVLLIACANVAGLLTSRAITRRHEMAVRAAVGASGFRIVRQLLTESLVLSLLGALAGVTLAHWAVPWLLGLTTLPRAAGVALDGTVFITALTAAVITGLTFGIGPALTASRMSQPAAMRVRGAASGGRTRPALLIVELAVTVVLLVGAGLLIRSFYNLQRVETGINIDRMLTSRFHLPRASYPAERCVALYGEMIDRIGALPGVEAAAAASVFPFSGTYANAVFAVPGRAPGPPGVVLTANFSAVTPGYFRTMGIPVLEGRGFESRDRADTPFVAVVNRAMADRYFPGQNPIGQAVRILGPKPRTIVGVIPDLRQRAPQTPAEPEIHVPHSQFPAGGMFLVVRTRSERPEDQAAAVRATVRSVDRDLAMATMQTGPQMVSEMLSSRRLSLVLLSAFGGVALILSVIGVYGALSFAVSQQAREIGIRMALGAARRDVLVLMLGQGMWPVGVGLAIGLGAALAATNLLATALFEVRPSDPLTLCGVGVVLLVVAFVTVLVPARRAARVDPLIAVRCD